MSSNFTPGQTLSQSPPPKKELPQWIKDLITVQPINTWTRTKCFLSLLSILFENFISSGLIYAWPILNHLYKQACLFLPDNLTKGHVNDTVRQLEIDEMSYCRYHYEFLRKLKSPTASENTNTNSLNRTTVTELSEITSEKGVYEALRSMETKQEHNQSKYFEYCIYSCAFFPFISSLLCYKYGVRLTRFIAFVPLFLGMFYFGRRSDKEVSIIAAFILISTLANFTQKPNLQLFTHTLLDRADLFSRNRSKKTKETLLKIYKLILIMSTGCVITAKFLYERNNGKDSPSKYINILAVMFLPVWNLRSVRVIPSEFMKGVIGPKSGKSSVEAANLMPKRSAVTCIEKPGPTQSSSLILNGIRKITSKNNSPRDESVKPSLNQVQPQHQQRNIRFVDDEQHSDVTHDLNTPTHNTQVVVRDDLQTQPQPTLPTITTSQTIEDMLDKSSLLTSPNTNLLLAEKTGLLSSNSTNSTSKCSEIGKITCVNKNSSLGSSVKSNMKTGMTSMFISSETSINVEKCEQQSEQSKPQLCAQKELFQQQSSTTPDLTTTLNQDLKLIKSLIKKTLKSWLSIKKILFFAWYTTMEFWNFLFIISYTTWARYQVGLNQSKCLLKTKVCDFTVSNLVNLYGYGHFLVPLFLYFGEVFLLRFLAWVREKREFGRGNQSEKQSLESSVSCSSEWSKETGGSDVSAGEKELELREIFRTLLRAAGNNQKKIDKLF